MDSFWDFFWLLVWTFFFVMYLMVLFQIIADLFRDRDLSGGWKALWVIFLIIFPFIAAIIYLIARGRGMAERQAGEMKKAQVAGPIHQVGCQSGQQSRRSDRVGEEPA